MTSLRVLRQQAEKIAKTLKAIDRDEYDRSIDPQGKIAQSKVEGTFKMGIVMDHKTVTIKIPWTFISASSETAIKAFVLKHMRDVRDGKTTVH